LMVQEPDKSRESDMAYQATFPLGKLRELGMGVGEIGTRNF